MEKEDWINEVMQSTKGIKAAEVNPFLVEKIALKIKSNENDLVEEKYFFKNWALAAMLIVLLNVVSYIYIQKDKQPQPKENGYISLSKEMGLTENPNY